MTDQLTGEPVEGAPTPEPEPTPLEPTEALPGESQEADGEPDETAEPISEPVEELVEVDIDGVKHKLPPALARYRDEVARGAQQKFEEAADLRKAAEARETELAARAEAIAQLEGDKAELTVNEKALRKFEDYFASQDWLNLQATEIDEAQKLALQYQTLQSTTGRLRESIQQEARDQEAKKEREQADLQRRHVALKADLDTTLAREIPNFSPKVRQEMVSAGTELGFDQGQIEATVDPKFWRALHYIRLGRAVEKRQKSAATPAEPEPVTPVSKASGGRSPTRGPSDDMPIEKWVAAERKRLASKNGVGS